jgi:hypothetical protein
MKSRSRRHGKASASLIYCPFVQPIVKIVPSQEGLRVAVIVVAVDVVSSHNDGEDGNIYFM